MNDSNLFNHLMSILKFYSAPKETVISMSELHEYLVIDDVARKVIKENDKNSDKMLTLLEELISLSGNIKNENRSHYFISAFDYEYDELFNYLKDRYKSKIDVAKEKHDEESQNKIKKMMDESRKKIERMMDEFPKKYPEFKHFLGR